VANIAGLRRGDVVRGLARCIDTRHNYPYHLFAAVTFSATPGVNFLVSARRHLHGLPGRHVMAGITALASRVVAGGLRVATCCCTRRLPRIQLFVINPLYRLPCCKHMACHAGSAGRNMRRGLTARALAIVTLETLGAGRGFMVVKRSRGHPDYGGMTGCAVGRGTQVVRNFTRCLHAVMAGHTRRIGVAVIHFRAYGKSERRMANITLLHGGNMVQVFTARDLAVVATRTLRRQPLKYSIDVTCFATLQGVQPNERETRGKMVEIFV